jgi:RNA polymerase sigma-70 factor (ECF subfamily)
MDRNKPDCESELQELLLRAGQGDATVLGELFSRFRDRLQLLVRLRFDRRLQGKFDFSDVLQDVYVEAAQRFNDYLQKPDLPLYLWLRFLTLQRLLIVHRRHAGTRMRDIAREVSLYQGAMPEASSAALAARLLGHRTTPSQAAMRAEMQIRLQDALNSLDATDREIIALRHFEELNNSEAAQVLGLSESGASRRYTKALLKLKDLLVSLGLGKKQI